ncbi:hypothetical protein TIFTF001_001536 [Ficus carica]|uniref:O-methyltransferase C-terminal domain-containing protein n=1 Tax=Ficus carica TaxID=3494 RepID=A0AA88CS01_FICCA|nr:hypothetical protein TIFTF001_001536 [Ficus carica]
MPSPSTTGGSRTQHKPHLFQLIALTQSPANHGRGQFLRPFVLRRNKYQLTTNAYWKQFIISFFIKAFHMKKKILINLPLNVTRTLVCNISSTFLCLDMHLDSLRWDAKRLPLPEKIRTCIITNLDAGARCSRLLRLITLRQVKVFVGKAWVFRPMENLHCSLAIGFAGVFSCSDLCASSFTLDSSKPPKNILTNDKKEKKKKNTLNVASQLLLDESPFIISMKPLVALYLIPKFVASWDSLSTWLGNSDASLLETVDAWKWWQRNHGQAITNIFPHVHCTVFDLPHVIADLQGTEKLNFVGDHALLSSGKGGKVIIIEMVLGNPINMDKESYELQLSNDMTMMAMSGKQRTITEWEKLFKDAGFSHYKITPILGEKSVIEVFP